MPSQLPDQVTAEHHFSTNINLAWQHLDKDYGKNDYSPLYTLAVVLHPRFKVRWFYQHWKERPAWHTAVKQRLDTAWRQYKDLSLDELKFELPDSVSEVQGGGRIYNDWQSDEDEGGTTNGTNLDELNQYLDEPKPRTPVDNAFAWWIEQIRRWPRLSAMALGVLTIPPMSDEPERKFSEAGDVVSHRRRRIN